MLAHYPLQRNLTPHVATHETARQCSVCGGANRVNGRQDTVTYVVQRGVYCKVGSTINLGGRLRTLASRRPGVVCPPDLDLESDATLRYLVLADREHPLHRYWSDHHVIGEWFWWAPIATFLESAGYLMDIVVPL
jgi:hypothetical protein